MGTLSPLLQQLLDPPFPLKERILLQAEGPNEVMNKSKLILNNGPQASNVSISLPLSIISPVCGSRKDRNVENKMFMQYCRYGNPGCFYVDC